MRVAVFTDLFLEISGGIPRSIEAQKTVLENMGHQVTVFCPGSSWHYQDEARTELRELEEEGIVVVPTARVKINGAPMGQTPKKLVRYLEQKYADFGKEFDLVHVHHEMTVSIAAVMMARKWNLPIVQTIHGREDMAVAYNVPFGLRTGAAMLLNMLHRGFLRSGVRNFGDVRIRKDRMVADTWSKAKMWSIMIRQAKLADVVLAPSEHFANKLRLYGAGKVEVLSNGVAKRDIELCDAKVRKLDESYIEDGERLRIIWSSRTSREKRLVPFIEALRTLRKTTDKFFVTIVGDGNELKRAKRLVKEYGLGEFVAFKGATPHDDLMKMYEKQHLSVINSYGFDTQGLTILESMATGLPVVYCDPDMDTIVLPGTGRRAMNATPEAMAELLVQILNHPKWIEEMSEEALKARGKVVQEEQIGRLMRVYGRVV